MSRHISISTGPYGVGEYWPGVRVWGIEEPAPRPAMQIGSVGKHDYRMIADRVGVLAGHKRGNAAQYLPDCDFPAITLTAGDVAMIGYLTPIDAAALGHRLICAAAAHGYALADGPKEGEDEWLFQRRMAEDAGTERPAWTMPKPAK